MPVSPLSPKGKRPEKKLVVSQPDKSKAVREEYDQSDLAECFDRLYDEDDYSYLPMEQQLAKYSKRDLHESKLYKTALSVYNISGPRPRNYTSEHIKQQFDKVAVPHALSAKYDVWKKETAALAKEAKVAELSRAVTIVTSDVEKDYHERMRRRMKLRADLNELGNVPKFLQAKCDRTPIEEAYLKRHFETEHAKRRAKTPPKTTKQSSPSRVRPTIRSPVPLALASIDKHLHDKRWRLLELFQQADVSKRWRLSVTECLRIVETEGLPVSKALLQQLVFELDKDGKGELDYRELVHGLLRYQREERPPYRYNSPKSRASSSKSRTCTPLSTDLSTTSSRPQSSSEASRKQHLTPPPPDSRPDAYQHANQESQVDARRAEMNMMQFEKRCKEAGLEPSGVHTDKFVVRIGYKKWDQHVAPSTLRGPSNLNDSVDRFRQAQFKEYLDLLQLCKQKGAVLNETLLERVLLYPGDQPTEAISGPGKLGEAGQDLLTKDSSKWHEIIAKYSDDDSDENGTASDSESSRRRSKQWSWLDRSTGIIDPKRAFPKYRRVAPRDRRVMLVTGPAILRRKVDNWMSFEEYMSFTQHIKSKGPLYGCSRRDTFWPGSMLKKLRLCLPPFDKKYSFPERSDVFFNRVPNEMH